MSYGNFLADLQKVDDLIGKYCRFYIYTILYTTNLRKLEVVTKTLNVGESK